MSVFPGLALHLAVALGIGLLIGAERERRKGQGPFRSPAGIRTFALASLSGAVSLVLLIAASVAGFADTHSPAVAVASLVAAGKLGVEQAVVPILAALSTNTITKLSLAIASGGRRFAAQLIPGLVLVVASAWAGVLHLIFS
jgi:hypothetical protein